MISTLSIYLQPSSTAESLQRIGKKGDDFSVRLEFGNLACQEVAKTIAFLVLDVFASIGNMLTLGQLRFLSEVERKFSELKYVSLIGAAIAAYGFFRPTSAKGIPQKIAAHVDKEFPQLIEGGAKKLDKQIEPKTKERQKREAKEQVVPTKVFKRRCATLRSGRKAKTKEWQRRYSNADKATKYAAIKEIKKEMRSCSRKETRELKGISGSQSEYEEFLKNQALEKANAAIKELWRFAREQGSRREKCEGDKFNATQYVNGVREVFEKDSELDVTFNDIFADFEKSEDKDNAFRRLEKQIRNTLSDQQGIIRRLERPRLDKWFWRRLIFPFWNCIPVAHRIVQWVDRVYDPHVPSG